MDFFLRKGINPVRQRPRDPSSSAVLDPFQTVSNLVLEGLQRFRNLRDQNCQEASRSTSSTHLPAEKWVQRDLRWKPAGARVAGHPRHDCISKLQSCTRHRHMDDWYAVASGDELRTQQGNLSKLLRLIRAAHGHSG